MLPATQLCVIQLAERTARAGASSEKWQIALTRPPRPRPRPRDPAASRQILSSSKSDLQFIILGLTKLVCLSHFEQATGGDLGPLHSPQKYEMETLG